jgi:hypothetical protein
MNTKKEVRELIEFASQVFESEHKELIEESKEIFLGDEEVNFCVGIMPMSNNRVNMFIAKPINPTNNEYTKLELIDTETVVSTSLEECFDYLTYRLNMLKHEKNENVVKAKEVIFIDGVKYRKEC